MNIESQIRSLENIVYCLTDAGHVPYVCIDQVKIDNLRVETNHRAQIHVYDALEQMRVRGNA